MFCQALSWSHSNYRPMPDRLYDPPEAPDHAGRLGRVNSTAGNRQPDEYFCGPFHAP
jgi:hypothetical protein